MALSREEVTQIAKASAQTILEGLHRYTVEYKEPETIEQGLEDSMIEERTAANWYRKRAEHATTYRDPQTAALYEHIAGEEDQHYDEFQNRFQGLAKQDNPGTPEVTAPEGIKRSGLVYSVRDKEALKQLTAIEDGATVKIEKYWIKVKFSEGTKHYDTASLLSTVEDYTTGKVQDVYVRPVFIDKFLHQLKEIKPVAAIPKAEPSTLKESQFKCKYCGDVAVTFIRGGWVPIVNPLHAEIWAGYHVKGKHRELIPKLAKERKPWSEIFEKPSYLKETKPAPGTPEVTANLEALSRFADRENWWVSGSYATGKATAESDIDILVGVTDNVFNEPMGFGIRDIEDDIWKTLPNADVFFYNLSDKSKVLQTPAFTKPGGIVEKSIVKGLWRTAKPIRELAIPKAEAGMPEAGLTL